MDTGRSCTCRKYSSQGEPTTFPSSAIPQGPHLHLTESSESKASATRFDPRDYAHLLLIPEHLCYAGRAEGGGWRPIVHMPFLPQVLLRNTLLTLSLGGFASPGVPLWHVGLLHWEVTS